MADDAIGLPHPMTASAESAVANLRKQLQSLLKTSWWSDADPKYFLDELQQATAVLQGCSIQDGAQLADPMHVNAILPDAAAASCITVLLQMLLQPPEQLFSGLGGVPCDPDPSMMTVSTNYHAIAAAQLHLLSVLLQLFGRLDMSRQDEQEPAKAEAAEEDSKSRNKPHYFVGIVEIEELDSDDPDVSSLTPQQQLQAQLQALVPEVLLAAALYAADSSSTATPEALSDAAPTRSSSSHGSRGSLERFCWRFVQQGLSTFTPWSCTTCQQQCQHLVHALLQQINFPLQTPEAAAAATATTTVAGADRSSRPSSQSAPGKAASWPATAPGQGSLAVNGTAAEAAAGLTGAAGHDPVGGASCQEAHAQLVWCSLLPQLLDGLRDTLLAQHRHRRAQEKGDMVAYNGPSTYKRCLAARQLAWLVQQLQQTSLTESDLGLMLPLLLATADDPSPAVQRYGHAALGWLGLHARPVVLRWQGALLADECKRLVVGCEESCWVTALPAATSLTLVLEGKDVRSPMYHTLMLELITEAERNAHKPQQRLVFMCCVARMVPRLGLYITRHFAALMPLLLEWCHAYDEDSSVVAMQLLALLGQHAWPRMSVHEAILCQHMVAVLKQVRVEQGGGEVACGQLPASSDGLMEQQEQQLQENMKGQNSAKHASVASGSLGSRRGQAAQHLLQVLAELSGSDDASRSTQQ